MPKTNTPDPNSRSTYLLSLWERAIPIQSASLKFGDPEMVKRCTDFGMKGAALPLIMNALAKSAGMADQMPEEFRASPEEALENSRLRETLMKSLVQRVSEGKFLALGYIYPRTIDDYPQIIPPEKVRDGLVRSSDRIEIGGLRIESVRVIPSEVEPILNAPERKSPGRPSKNRVIKEAYEVCVANNEIDFSRPKSEAFDRITLRIKETHPKEFGDGGGFQYETVRRCIAPDFDKRRAALKPH